MRFSRWIIFAPVAILALFAPQANAEPIAGLQTRYFIIDEVPPTRADNIYTECGSEVENNINRSYDGEPYLDCTNDLFMVHMTGFIQIPEHDTIEFWLASDDGGTINIGGNEWGNWSDQGCSATESGEIDISAGSQPLDLWMYENGGASCLLLAWNINNQGWSIVPDEAFTTDSQVSVTTTTDSPVTTIQETTTSWTTTSSTTTTTTTSTIAPYGTVPVTNPSTTTTPQTISIYPPEPTMPDPPATVPELQIDPPAILDTIVLPPEIESFPPETLELPPYIVDTMPFPVDTYPTIGPPQTLPFVGELPEPPDTIELPPDTLPIDLILELPPELVQALEDASEDVSLTDEQFTTAVEAIADLTPSEAVALIQQILDTAVTSEQATELASNPDVLAVVTSEQAEEIFATIDVTELDDTQLDALVEAVQSAPISVRKAFEKTINIFDDGLGDYVPTGSNIPVHSRRTLIAVAAGAATVTAGQRRNK